MTSQVGTLPPSEDGYKPHDARGNEGARSGYLGKKKVSVIYEVDFSAGTKASEIIRHLNFMEEGRNAPKFSIQINDF